MEVVQGGALAQELGRGEEARRIDDRALAEQTLARADGQGAANDDDRTNLASAQLGEDPIHRACVRATILVDGRPDADQDDAGGRARRGCDPPRHALSA